MHIDIDHGPLGLAINRSWVRLQVTMLLMQPDTHVPQSPSSISTSWEANHRSGFALAMQSQTTVVLPPMSSRSMLGR